MKAPPDTNKFVTDTHPLVWHLSSSSGLSTEARRRFLMADQGETIIYFSSMTLVEMIYLAEKDRISMALVNIFRERIESKKTDSYQLAPLTSEIAWTLKNVPREIIPELPDRVIAATAYHLNLPLITKDHRIREWEGVVTIW